MATRAALLTARAFCRALEEGDTLTVQAFLAPDCRYRSPDGITFRGHEIAESYRVRSTWARNNLGELSFESEVAECGIGVEVRFTDRIRFQGQEHVYRLTQYLEIEDGRIVRMEDRENPGEEGALKSFVEAPAEPRREPEVVEPPKVESPEPPKVAEVRPVPVDYPDDPESAEDRWDDAGAHQESDNN